MLKEYNLVLELTTMSPRRIHLSQCKCLTLQQIVFDIKASYKVSGGIFDADVESAMRITLAPRPLKKQNTNSGPLVFSPSLVLQDKMFCFRRTICNTVGV